MLNQQLRMFCKSVIKATMDLIATQISLIWKLFVPVQGATYSICTEVYVYRYISRSFSRFLIFWCEENQEKELEISINIYLKLWPGIFHFDLNVTSCRYLVVLVLPFVIQIHCFKKNNKAQLHLGWIWSDAWVAMLKSFVCESCDQLLSAWHGKSLVLKCI